MPNDEDPRDVEREPESSDELNSEELDQVVGGTDPKPTLTGKPTISEITISKTTDTASP